MKKKILTLLSVVCFSVIGLVACSNSSASTEPVPDFVAEYEAEIAAIKEAAVNAVTATPKPTPTVTPSPTPVIKKFGSVVGPADVTCYFNELTFLSSNGTKHTINADGSISLQYQGSYSEVKLRLPQTLDMTYCTGITVNMKNEVDTLAIKLLDASLKQAFVSYEEASVGTKDIKLVPELTSTVSTIALMGAEEVANYSDYATVYSLTFHFSEEFDGSVHAK